MYAEDLFDSEHAPLLDLLERQLGMLSTGSGLVRSLGDAWHAEIGEFGDRLVSFGSYLYSARALASVGQYPAALAICRAALEHHVFDLLLFLANRYEETHTGVTRDRYDRLVAALEAGVDTDIVSHDYRNGTLRIIRRGMVGEDGTELSRYYFLYHEVDPFLGTAEEQADLASSFTQLERRQEWARHNESLRHGRIGWQHLLRNLVMNDLMTERQVSRLQVHYRFLGAYVHPTAQESQQLVQSPSHRSYDHYAAELVLLYAVILADRELAAFVQLCERRSSYEFLQLDEFAQLREFAAERAGHFWWIDNAPHEFDRVAEANSRGLSEDRQWVPREGRQPEAIPEDEIRYFRNPLRRLIEQHGNFNELTGFAYQSPWPRDDAWRRS